MPTRELPTAVCVVGPRDAGKTTVIEHLVPHLQDYSRVATVKSIHHDIDVDQRGKDTYRHRDAGAEHVVGVTPSLTFSVTARGKDDHEGGATGLLDELLGRLGADGYDIVLVEGFSTSTLPKILVGGRQDVNGPVLTQIDEPDSFDPDEVADTIVSFEEQGTTGG